ncbi:MAG: Hpt domain-containing protein [Candidatus Methylacidiphilales bacterium]|nr:Hpt domain-containing protein [Candidatus Methylacidiphilales bacterium]
MIDWLQIDEVLTPNGDPIEVEIYREFLTATRDTLAVVERLLREGAPAKEILWELHRVKGSCATFGLSGAADRIYDWETRIKSGGVSPSLEDMADFMTYFHQSLDLLKKQRPERMALVFAEPSPF